MPTAPWPPYLHSVTQGSVITCGPGVRCLNVKAQRGLQYGVVGSFCSVSLGVTSGGDEHVCLITIDPSCFRPDLSR